MTVLGVSPQAVVGASRSNLSPRHPRHRPLRPGSYFSTSLSISASSNQEFTARRKGRQGTQRRIQSGPLCDPPRPLRHRGHFHNQRSVGSGPRKEIRNYGSQQFVDRWQRRVRPAAASGSCQPAGGGGGGRGRLGVGHVSAHAAAGCGHQSGSRLQQSRDFVGIASRPQKTPVLAGRAGAFGNSVQITAAAL
jgi:hypothetical protein